MNRRAVVAILSSASLVGCAQSRSVMPGVGPVDPMTSTATLAPIGQTINGGFSPTDPGLQRVAFPPPQGATAPRVAPASTPKAPAPFAVPTPASVVPRAIPDLPAPIETAVPAPSAVPELPPAAAVPAPSAPSASKADPVAPPDPPIPDTPPASALAPTAQVEPPALPPLPPGGVGDPDLVPTAQVVKPPADPAVKPTSTLGDPTKVRAAVPKNSPLRKDEPVTQIAATIGTEEITFSELDRRREKRHLPGARPSARSPGRTATSSPR